ncbi:hypothetical protein ABE28_004645 [Peribacillus muralis]|uniref:non-specific protein-tyrosine kinase n=1 Tax=Peribacillus muralis TaxID=264697 RepID=A0A1B3XK93_9BACI|nr:CpsD/CapB family tyrosine-protein kinase [Peribacillus muralis]AOH53629.1 hypothetical protein ABE28_004645 [Peribacillus muralis]
MKPRTATKKINKNNLITKIDPKSLISEDFRVIRTNIDYSRIDSQYKSIMITSPEPNSGKSVVSANLAVVFAQQGKSTLLIDGDLRKSSVQYFFPEVRSAGLTALLTGRISLEEAIEETEVKNLFVLPAGFISTNPAELLSSKKMKELFKRLLTMYEQIIIDTPPILAVADAQIISSLVDGTILVFRSGYTSKTNAKKSVHVLQQVHGKIICSILNDHKNKKDAYYYGK